MIHNYMATLVNNTLADELASNPHKYTGVCQCPHCLAYIKACALNALSPYYVTTLAGEVFGEYASKEKQNRAEVLVAIGRGIDELQNAGLHSGR